MGEHEQLVCLLGRHARFLNGLEGIFNALRDSLALIRDALAGLFHAFCLSKRLSDLLNAIGFRQILRSQAHTLGGVDLVHGIFNFLRKRNARDECAHQREAVSGHLLAHRRVHIFGDVVFLSEYLIERIRRNTRAQCVGNEVFHLLNGLLQHVVALENTRFHGIVAQRVIDVVLRGNIEADGHIVLGFHIDAEAVLHGSQAHCRSFALEERDLHVEAGTHEAIEFAQALDDHRMLLFYDEQAIFDDGRDNQNENDEEHKTANHDGTFLLGDDATILAGADTYTASRAREISRHVRLNETSQRGDIHTERNDGKRLSNKAEMGRRCIMADDHDPTLRRSASDPYKHRLSPSATAARLDRRPSGSATKKNAAWQSGVFVNPSLHSRPRKASRALLWEARFEPGHAGCLRQ